MEIATTGSMGDKLIAPKLPAPKWSYELVRLVHSGDRVLHWQSGGGMTGLVGWSVASGEPEVVPEYTWQPRGTSGRALAGPRTTEGWMVPLGGLHQFQQPFTADEIPPLMHSVLELKEGLEHLHGKPIYFPFYLYGGRELRAQQGYLVKFPLELFDLLPSIGSARIEAPSEEEVVEDNERPRRLVRRGQLTRVEDPQLRSAIETHAVEMTIEYYRRLGGIDFVKLGKPYDVQFVLHGIERHLEVKGSSLFIETVELTINEVLHAQDFQPTDLVVVDGIQWSRLDGEIATRGGRLRVWADWSPHEDHLSVRKYAYSLPGS